MYKAKCLLFRCLPKGRINTCAFRPTRAPVPTGPCLGIAAWQSPSAVVSGLRVSC